MPRLFVAIRVPPNDRLTALLGRLDDLRGVKAVEPENLHFTLRFLGDVTHEQKDGLLDVLKEATIDVRPFDVQICGTGTFPDGNKPKVVWVGCTPEAHDPLRQLADAVDGFADEVGLGPRDKPFVPHLTLARVKRPESRSMEEVVHIVRGAKDAEFGSCRVDKVALVESRLTDQGPVYTDIAEVPLE